MKKIKLECRRRWREGTFIEHGHAVPSIPSGLVWQPYETYMSAAIVSGGVGEVTRLLVDFPADGCEDNRLHVHPISDRIITILSGSGDFIAVRSRRVERWALTPGMKVWMPRGVLHTFMAGASGMLVESIHSPFVALDAPEALVYPSKGGFHV